MVLVTSLWERIWRRERAGEWTVLRARAFAPVLCFEFGGGVVLQAAPSQSGGSSDTTDNEDAGRGQGFICVS